VLRRRLGLACHLRLLGWVGILVQPLKRGCDVSGRPTARLQQGALRILAAVAHEEQALHVCGVLLAALLRLLD